MLAMLIQQGLKSQFMSRERLSFASQQPENIDTVLIDWNVESENETKPPSVGPRCPWPIDGWHPTIGVQMSKYKSPFHLWVMDPITLRLAIEFRLPCSQQFPWQTGGKNHSILKHYTSND